MIIPDAALILSVLFVMSLLEGVFVFTEVSFEKYILDACVVVLVAVIIITDSANSGLILPILSARYQYMVIWNDKSMNNTASRSIFHIPVSK